MSFAKIKGALTTRIGRPVYYGAPQDVRKRNGIGRTGKIIDEVWADSNINSKAQHLSPCAQGDHCWGDYSFAAHLIEWHDGEYSIRLAYYRRRCGENSWEYASQMTVDSDWRTIKTLMERTLAKASWFSDAPKVPN